MEHWHGARNIGTLAMMLWRYRVSHSVPDPDPELLMMFSLRFQKTGNWDGVFAYSYPAFLLIRRLLTHKTHALPSSILDHVSLRINYLLRSDYRLHLLATLLSLFLPQIATTGLAPATANGDTSQTTKCHSDTQAHNSPFHWKKVSV